MDDGRPSLSGPKAQQSIELVLAAARAALGATSTSSRADAEILLSEVLGCSRSHLVAWPREMVPPPRLEVYRRLIGRRAAGCPLAYLAGRKEFWSLPLRVDESTLIPRPETETLVEFVLALYDADSRNEVADLGTGSGAIACALAVERPGWEIRASDRSAAALAVARRNALGLGLRNVRCVQGDWFDAFDAAVRFDLVVSNPPYIAAGDPHLTRGDLLFEPEMALVAGPDGLDAIRRIVSRAPERLKPAGWLVLEHGYDQSRAVAALLRESGLVQVEQRRDLAGIVRMSAARRA